MTDSFSASEHAERGIDVFLRVHDPRRLLELDRAMFSLVGQQYRPLRILMVCQRFSEAALAELEQYFAPMLTGVQGISLQLLNFTRDDPKDARSELINLGFAAATGRYAALLDYDDVLYPEAYRLLIGQLVAGGGAIAFGRVKVATADMHKHFVHAVGQSSPFTGDSLADLFVGNFAPIHSFVVDRSRVPREELRFEPRLTLEEDYDFLLRACAVAEADFTLLHTEIGLYFFKTDESNTVIRTGSTLSADTLARLEVARQFVEIRRRMTPIAPAIQEALGISPPEPGLTIRDFLTRRSGAAAGQPA
jgi:hypothetical protein